MSPTRINTVINIAGLLLIYVFISLRYDLSLLFTDTILTGGDSASWYQIALHLQNDLIPNGRLFGWSQENFFGYNNLLHYFVFPFTLIVALGQLLPLTVALKLVSFAGILVTPLATFYALRKLRYSDPVPLIGAWASLYFLFHEHFSIFGANALSTLAGEFSFSLAFTLFIVFIASFENGLRTKRHQAFNAILLALIGLSHAFVFFSAVLVPLYYVLGKKTCRENLPYVIIVYGVAFLLMAFWALPMLADRAYTAPIKMIWNFYSTKQFIDELGLFTIVMTAIALCLAFLPRWHSRHTPFYLYMLATSIALYFIATSLKIPDIRFFPVWLFFSIMLALDLLAQMFKYSTHKVLGFGAIVSAVLLGSSQIFGPDKVSPLWFQNNYQGYEHTRAYKDGTHTQLMEFLRGDLNDGRVAVEHVTNSVEYGSDRAFENLSMMAGRQTTDGIHYASGYLSKTITAMTGEYSLTSGGAEPVISAHPDVERLREHFRLFNITDLLIKTPKIRAMIDSSDDFSLVGNAGPYSVYRLTDYTSHYIEVLDKQPPILEIQSPRHETAIRNWFRRNGKVSDIFLNQADAGILNTLTEFSRGTLDVTGRSSIPSRGNTPPVNPVVSDERVSSLRIQFNTQQVGKPHLIKITYSPNWQSVNGETLYRIAPGLMLIYPTTEQVTLDFERNATEWFSLLLTILGIMLLVTGRLKHSLSLSSLQKSPAVTACANGLSHARLPILTVLIVSVLLLSFDAWQEKRIIGSDQHRGNQLFSKNHYAEAIRFYEKVTTPDIIAKYDRYEIPHALLAQGRAYLYLKDDDKAYEKLSLLLDAYPGWKLIDVAYELLADIEARRGNLKQADIYSRECFRLTSYKQLKRHCQY